MSLAPALLMFYSTVVLGHNDVVAATGAALDTMYFNCPECLDEIKKLNAISLGGWTSSAYLLNCTTPVKSLAVLKGKRIRATGDVEESRFALYALSDGSFRFTRVVP